MSPAESLVQATIGLSASLESLQFSSPVGWVYNPLQYAAGAHHSYLRRFISPPCRVLFLGMNPGPFGMMQTGVPFGEVQAVRDWMGIADGVTPPARMHPSRPILGFQCPRSEVSGKRLWGLFRQRFGTAERFFAEHVVLNSAPPGYLTENGANLTPDRLPAAERALLFAHCDAFLRQAAGILAPQWVVGIGHFAQKRALDALQGLPNFRYCRIPHPSPANPAANRDWATAARSALSAAGVW